MRPVGKLAIPELKSGKPRAWRCAPRGPVLYGLRQAETTVTRDVDVRLEPPQDLAGFHLPLREPRRQRVRGLPRHAGRRRLRRSRRRPRISRLPGKGRGHHHGPGAARGVLRLLYDQDLNTPIQLFARDEAGNEATVALDHQVFPKPYAKSRIELNDAFLQRVVPAIAGASPDEGIATDDILAGFLKINGDLRRKNNALVAALAAKTSPDMKFKDAFQQLGDSQVEARFADTRTYVYKGKEVDRQVHLGYDLAVTAQVAIAASPAWHRGARRGPRHLRQLRGARSRPGRAVAVRPPVVDRREGGRFGGERARRSAAAG